MPRVLFGPKGWFLITGFGLYGMAAVMMVTGVVLRDPWHGSAGLDMLILGGAMQSMVLVQLLISARSPGSWGAGGWPPGWAGKRQTAIVIGLAIAVAVLFGATATLSGCCGEAGLWLGPAVAAGVSAAAQCLMVWRTRRLWMRQQAGPAPMADSGGRMQECEGPRPQ